MRCLLLLVAVVVGTQDTAHAVGILHYDRARLNDQLEQCAPSGPHPYLGCDQKLAYATWGSFDQVFCSPDRADCRRYRDECDICNGVCRSRIVWQRGSILTFLVGEYPNVEQIIGDNQQWHWDVHCPQPEVGGAYFLGVDFLGMIRLFTSSHDYNHMMDRREVQDVLAVTTLAPAETPEEAWRRRLGLTGILVEIVGSEYWQRAHRLCVWWWIDRYAPDREAWMTAAQLPPSLAVDEWNDLLDIFDATCSHPLFRDCDTAVRPTTWGRLKYEVGEPR